MKEHKLKNTLLDIGLTENEASVYISSLALGPTTIIKLSKAAEINRTTVYTIIESLKKKGLMYIEPHGFKQLYAAEHPNKLSNTLQSKKNNLERLLPEFIGLFNLKGQESKIRYYEGLTSIQQLYMDTLDDPGYQEDYLVITNQEKWYSLDEKFAQKYIEKRAKKMIQTRMLFTDSTIAQEHKEYEKNYNQEVRILPKDDALDTDLVITPKRIIISQTSLPYSAIEIQSPSVVKMQKSLFEIIWNKF